MKITSDIGMIAEVDGKIIGVAWVRIMNDYGHIDQKTPSVAISLLYKAYRNHEIGKSLMKKLLEKVMSKGYHKVSLAVQKENYAVKMYRKLGFMTVSENEEE